MYHSPLWLTLLIAIFLVGCSQPAPKACPPGIWVDKVAASADKATARGNDLPYQFPLDDYTILQPPTDTNFVNRGNELANDAKYHAAKDILHSAGTPVYAIANGEVSFSGPMGGYGLIIIDHPQANLYSLYGHLTTTTHKYVRKNWVYLGQEKKICQVRNPSTQ